MLWPYWALVATITSQMISKTSSPLMSARLLQETLEDAGYKLERRYEKDGQQVTFAYTGDGTTVKNRAAAIQKMCKDALAST